MKSTDTQEWKNLLKAMEAHAKEGARLRKLLQEAIDRQAIASVQSKIKK